MFYELIIMNNKIFKLFCENCKNDFKYHLKRMDDNGNTFLIEKFKFLLQAEDKMKELTKYQHKQVYWIEDETITNPRKQNK